MHTGTTEPDHTTTEPVHTTTDSVKGNHIYPAYPQHTTPGKY